MSETKIVNQEALDIFFNNARTFSAWKNIPVDESLLQRVFDLAILGPTSANTLPQRIVFLTSAEAKERLLPGLAEGNREKSRTAPVVALLAYDMEFYEKSGKLFPHANVKSWFEGNPAAAEKSAVQNASLQAAYFILAARSLGLDCGPMTGFEADIVNKEFFADSKWKINIVLNLGYGDSEKLRPRLPRLSFEEACLVIR